MEYPPLVAGQHGVFAVHLTRLSDFSAITTVGGRGSSSRRRRAGRLLCCREMNPRGQVSSERSAAPPAGRYRWALIVDAPGISDRHDLGVVTVFSDERSSLRMRNSTRRGLHRDTYLKEPQWMNGFGTVLVQQREVRRAIRVPAVIAPHRGRRLSPHRQWSVHVCHVARGRHARANGPGARTAATTFRRGWDRSRHARRCRVRGGVWDRSGARDLARSERSAERAVPPSRRRGARA